MPLDADKIKKFWDAQAQKVKHLKLEGIANLEEDPQLLQAKIEKETRKIMGIVNLDKSMRVLDLGAGVGQWSFRFSEYAKQVVAVEYSSDMCYLAIQEANNLGIDNIEFVNIAAQDYHTDASFDFIYISGLLIYLDDKESEQLIQQCAKHLSQDGRLVLRDGTGINGRHEINDNYSKALNAYYSATYRTADQYISLFESHGFILIKHEDMFEAGSALNKWEETRLRVYQFRKVNND
jgi:ubiquinone/menaquinone biosynthesis C-methylase UbiE